jgi:putative membrane protein
MLLTDLTMEQICAKLDFWYWEKGAAPMQNYLAWFVLGLGVQWGIHSTLKERSFNKLALPLYVLQFLFFAGLIFFLKA